MDREPHWGEIPDRIGICVVWAHECETGFAGEPRDPRGRPRPRHPDPAAGVRRLRQRGREVPRRRDRRERVHRLPAQAGRLRPAPGRRPDDPRQAAVGRHHARADGDVRRRRRAVGAAQEGPHHDAAEHPDAPRPAAGRGRADPRDLRRRALQPRGLRQHGPQRHRRPVGRRVPRRDVRPDAVRRRLRALLRAPPHDAADAAQGQDRVHGLGHRSRAHRHPRRRLHRPRARRRQGLRAADRRRHVDHAARRAHADRLRARRRRRVPQVHRGRPADLRPPGLAARQPRPRPPEGDGRQDRHRGDARARRGGAAGRLGRRARLLGRRPAVPARRGGGRARAAGRRPARRTATCTEFRRFHAANVEAQRQEGFSAVQVKVTRGDLSPEQFRGLAAIMREFSGGYARTTVHQNFVLRWVRDEAVYDVWTRLQGARPRRGRRRPGQRRRVVPRDRLLQARHHELDGAQPRDHASGSRR